MGGSISHYTSYSLQHVSHCTVVLSATITSHVLVQCIMVGLHVVMDVTMSLLLTTLQHVIVMYLILLVAVC